MAETERTFPALQALLADNTVEAISPQDLRDAIVSCLGGYASMYVSANVIAQAVTAAPAILTAASSAGPARGASADVATDKITIGVAGDYQITFCASLSASAPTVLDVTVYKGGVALGGFAARVAVGTDVVNVVLNDFATLALADAVDIRVACTPNADITARCTHFSVKRIG